jgi:hypothetical protein
MQAKVNIQKQAKAAYLYPPRRGHIPTSTGTHNAMEHSDLKKDIVLEMRCTFNRHGDVSNKRSRIDLNNDDIDYVADH